MVGVICPWNTPILVALADAVPALLAGAAVAIKPSELTPLSTREIVRSWREEVRAPGVLECLTGAGETGSALVDEADFIQFTGSTRTGRKIAQRAAERLIPYSLELGGKDAMIVLADADLERAANAAVWGGMFNSGQACTSVERVFVEEQVYDEFVEFVAGRVRGLRQPAAGKRFDGDVGALSSEAQLAIIERHVSEALANGARALVGGKRADSPLAPAQSPQPRPRLLARRRRPRAHRPRRLTPSRAAGPRAPRARPAPRHARTPRSRPARAPSCTAPVPAPDAPRSPASMRSPRPSTASPPSPLTATAIPRSPNSST